MSLNDFIQQKAKQHGIMVFQHSNIFDIVWHWCLLCLVANTARIEAYLTVNRKINDAGAIVWKLGVTAAVNIDSLGYTWGKDWVIRSHNR